VVACEHSTLHVLGMDIRSGLPCCWCCCHRLAALETLLEEGELMNEDGGYPLLPGAFRLVFAQLAASLNRLADAVDPNSSSKQGAAGAFCSAASLFGRTWEACREELLTSVSDAVQHHWQRVAAADEIHVNWGNVHEVGGDMTARRDGQACDRRQWVQACISHLGSSAKALVQELHVGPMVLETIIG
jgi:hypothetical protein